MRFLAGTVLALVSAVALSTAPAQPRGCDNSQTRPEATTRDGRFLGKVDEVTARCRGGERAASRINTPWNDWANYYGAGDATSLSASADDNKRGIIGALEDLGLQKEELFKFNLFDNNGTFEAYVRGRGGVAGPLLKTWPELRLPPSAPQFAAVGGARDQLCGGDLIRWRTVTGICNDIRNPLMGATGTVFATNADFADQYPDKGLNEITRNRHGDRLSLLQPDPQAISRILFTRAQSNPAACADGFGTSCDYKKAPFLNVMAAFWIQFMTHDWFTHLDEGHNDTSDFMKVGCTDPARDGCRPGDRIDRAYVAEANPPGSFDDGGQPVQKRDPRTHANLTTAWWDASQIYGYDDRSRVRVKRDPGDRARLLMVPVKGRDTAGDRQGYLPLLDRADPKLKDWDGQEATGFPDNWTVGVSFFHNVFAREHNQFVAAFRRRAASMPDADSGLRNPARPGRILRYRDVTPDELFEVARLVVSAEIAKIHTIEWTTQLLYNEPLFLGMNANWGGLPGKEAEVPGIVGTGSHTAGWSLANPDDVNGGTNHFGSPFAFPEEFISVYRLHTLVPDLIEYRDYRKPNAIAHAVPVVETFRGKATAFTRDRGLANWAISMGRQRVGTIELQNAPRFLQNIRIARLPGTGQIDVVALDIVRDRERGVPRFNEFRRQYGLPQLTTYEELVGDAPLASTLRGIYGQHRCDASKVITIAQRNRDGSPINDCLGRPDGTVVDNIEDVDTMVGWLGESTRPHGFAISETQFVVFILNASRRLYSDRFLTSSFRPEFYTSFGLDWVNNNGPEPQIEPAPINGHAKQPVSPLKRVLMRVIPELTPELAPLHNAFDPWARDPGVYYSLQWKPRPGAEGDKSFANPSAASVPAASKPVRPGKGGSD